MVPVDSPINPPQDFLPASQQSALLFDEHFSGAGLEVLVKYRRAQESAEKRRALKKELEELLDADSLSEEIIDRCQQHMDTAQLTDVDVTVLVSGLQVNCVIGQQCVYVCVHAVCVCVCAAVEMYYGQCGVEQEG